MLISFTKEEITDIKKLIDIISDAAYDAEKIVYGHEISNDDHPLCGKLDIITDTAIDLYNKFTLDDE